MTAHTPGPWKVTGLSGNDGDIKIIEADTRTVAWTPITSDNGECLSNQGKANARLIAAAPELLETLERLNLLEIESTEAGTVAEGPELREWSDAFEQAREAIAKAKGA